jgi:hypothetical protein
MLGFLLSSLNGIISGADVTQKLTWGDEAKRLAPTPALCVVGEASFEQVLNSTAQVPPMPPLDTVSTQVAVT